jgi:hypothetical protein
MVLKSAACGRARARSILAAGAQAALRLCVAVQLAELLSFGKKQKPSDPPVFRCLS